MSRGGSTSDPAGTTLRDPWKHAFVASLVLVAGSGVFLLYALATHESRDGLPADGGFIPSFPGTAQATPSPSPVKVSGLVPPLVGTSQFAVVSGGGREDLVVAPAPFRTEHSVPARVFVPIVSPATGVYDLTGGQLESLLGGQIRDWSEVGGLDGPVSIVRSPADDASLLGSWFPDLGQPGLSTYAEVVSTVASEKGAVAMVPVGALGPSVVSVAVDGLDPVRRGGDATPWRYREHLDITALTPRGRAAVDALRDLLVVPDPVPITVVLTGDILQSRCTLDRIRATGDWGAALRSPVGEYLASADLALGSLDGSIQDINPPFGCVAMTNLSSPPEVIEALTLAGIDGMTVATNHIFDCGEAYCGNRAFLRTLELLNAAGIKTWGGGKNLEEALAPGIFEVGGVRFGVLGFDDVAAYELEATATDPGTAPLDDDYSEEIAAGEPSFYRPASELSINRFLATIRSLRTQVDVVIVQVQSGTEETHAPSPRSLKALRAAVDAGADVVVGNQAHWVQAVEYGERSFVAYALGNFIFDQVWTPEHTEGVLLEATFHGSKLVTTRLRPYVIVDQYQPQFVSGDSDLRTCACSTSCWIACNSLSRARKILGDIYEASANLPPRAGTSVPSR